MSEQLITTHEQFGDESRVFVAGCLEMLLNKNAQYADGPDALANFRETAGFLGCSMEAALAPHLHKHYRSMMSSLSKEGGYNANVLRSHLEDIINYCIILNIILTEREAS